MVLLIQELVPQWSHIDPGIIRKGSQLTIPFDRIQHYFPRLILFVEPPSFLTSTKFFGSVEAFDVTWVYVQALEKGFNYLISSFWMFRGLSNALMRGEGSVMRPHSQEYRCSHPYYSEAVSQLLIETHLDDTTTPQYCCE